MTTEEKLKEAIELLEHIRAAGIDYEFLHYMSVVAFLERVK